MHLIHAFEIGIQSLLQLNAKIVHLISAIILLYHINLPAKKSSTTTVAVWPKTSTASMVKL